MKEKNLLAAKEEQRNQIKNEVRESAKKEISDIVLGVKEYLLVDIAHKKFINRWESANPGADIDEAMQKDKALSNEYGRYLGMMLGASERQYNAEDALKVKIQAAYKKRGIDGFAHPNPSVKAGAEDKPVQDTSEGALMVREIRKESIKMAEALVTAELTAKEKGTTVPLLPAGPRRMQIQR